MLRTQEDTTGCNSWIATGTKKPLARHASNAERLSGKCENWCATGHKMTQWAIGVPMSEDEDDDEWDDIGESSHCHHQGITGTFCPLCKDTGFIHESVGVRRVWQEPVRSRAQNRLAQMAESV